MKEKTPMSHEVYAFGCLISRPQNLNLRSQIKFMENYFLLENYATSEGAVSHNVLYYQPLPIIHYQVSFN